MNMMIQRLTLVVSLFFTLSVTLGCATYQVKVEKAREALKNHDYQAALADLESLAKKQGDDQLVYLLDYAVAQQVAGDLEGSVQSLLAADRLAEQVDYQSVSRIAGSLALNEEMVQYKGDTFEKIFINAYLAMNFLDQNKLDEALVEARRINEKYLKYRADEKKKFELNSFSKYLSALTWEANGNYDDAYIAYNETYKIDPTIKVLRQDLIRSAKLARRMDAYNEWKKKFPEVKESPDWYDSTLGELVVIYQQGWGPRKVQDPGSSSMPILRPVRSKTHRIALDVEGQKPVESEIVYDVESAAIQTLQEDYGILVAKRLAGIATKQILADQVRQKNELLGAMTWVALFASDRADLRQWSLLPQTIQISRIRLQPGTYKFALQGQGSDGVATGENLSGQSVQIKRNQKSFVIWRSLN